MNDSMTHSLGHFTCHQLYWRIDVTVFSIYLIKLETWYIKEMTDVILIYIII